MSAECSRCGSDIVYPDGTWPVGECPVCSVSAAARALATENKRLRELLASTTETAKPATPKESS